LPQHVADMFENVTYILFMFQVTLTPGYPSESPPVYQLR